MADVMLPPKVRLSPARRWAVTPGVPFDVGVSVQNVNEVLDAFDLELLGVPRDALAKQPEPVSLFPKKERNVTLQVTLPVDFPAGEQSLWVKVSSCPDPSVATMAELQLDVAASASITVEIDPVSSVAGRKGRYGLTVHNDGNSPVDVRFTGEDDANHLSFRFVDETMFRLAAGATSSVQAIVTGRRGFTGGAVPRQFTITAEYPGHRVPVTATFAQRPYIPQLALVMAGMVALLGFWALIVGVAIEAVISDSSSDVADSFEDGMNAVVDGLGDDAGAVEEARQETLAAVPTELSEAFGIAQAGGGDAAISIGSGSVDGLTGVGVNVTVTGEGQAPGPVSVPTDAILGTVVAASDGSPLPGAKVQVQALLAGTTDADPNRDPITVASDDTGVFSILKLNPGTYAVTIAAPGFVTGTCTGVVVPGPSAADSCPGLAPGAQVGSGLTSSVLLSGEGASIAGIVAGEDGNPIPGATISIAWLPAPEGAPVAIPSGSLDPVPLPADGRFSFILTSDQDVVPGTFEITAGAPDLVTKRLTVTLNGGDAVSGQEIMLTQIPPPVSGPPSDNALTGTVRDATGPLANVTVLVTNAEKSLELTTVTDAAGTYSLTGLPPGTYNVLFTRDGYLPRSDSAALDGAASVAVNAQLTGAVSRIRGTVTDSSTGLALGGVSVTVTPGNLTRVTDGIGGYDVGGLVPGDYTVVYRRADYATLEAKIEFDRAEVRVADAAMRPTGSLSGTVTASTSGRPVGNASVVAVGPSGLKLAATTDVAGAYTLDRVAPGSYAVSISAPGFTTTTSAGSVPGAIPTSLAGSSSLAGTVTLPAAQAGAAVTVTVTRPGIAAPLVATFSGTGGYSFGALEPGLYNAVFSYTPSAPATEDVTETLAIPVSDTTTFDVTLPEPPPPPTTAPPTTVPPTTAPPTTAP